MAQHSEPKATSAVALAFADANAIDYEALLQYPTPVLRQARGLAVGISRGADGGGYEQVREVIERAIRTLEAVPSEVPHSKP